MDKHQSCKLLSVCNVLLSFLTYYDCQVGLFLLATGQTNLQWKVTIESKHTTK